MNERPQDSDVGPARLPHETSEIRAIANAYDLLATWPRRPDSADPRAQTLYRRLGLRRLDELTYLVGSADDVERLQQRVKSVASPAADTERAIQQHLELRGDLP